MSANSEVIPLTSAKEISKQWLEKILTLKLNTPVSVKSWKVKTPESKEGFLSEICFVHVVANTADRTDERALVVKFMPEEKECIEFIKIGNLGKREIGFYTHAGSEEFVSFCQLSGLDHPVPDVYCSCMRDDLLTLVLSDLNAEGYRLWVPAEGNSLQQIKCTLESIAVIHAFGFAAIRKHVKEHFHIPYDSNYLDDLVCQGLRSQIDLLAEHPVAETLDALLPLHKALINTSHSFPLIDTLVHGDLWAGNVMFTADNKRACIFDWQFACVDNPLCDITAMLMMSGEPSVYEEHLTEVLESYWKSFTSALVKNGVEITICFEDILSNLEKMWMHGFMFLTASLPDMMVNHKITEARVQRVISFLEKRGAFSTFLKLYKQ